jgi:hypothetical protein
MKYKLIVSLLSLRLVTGAWAIAPKNNDKTDNELQRATETIQHLTSAAPDQGVPNKVFEGAKCIAVVPRLAKGASWWVPSMARAWLPAVPGMAHGVRRRRFPSPA